MYSQLKQCIALPYRIVADAVCDATGVKSMHKSPAYKKNLFLLRTQMIVIA
jgi:hypothetical protein